MTTQVSLQRTEMCIPYTGTVDQPDSVSLFYKHSDGHVEIANEEIMNSLGYNPVNMALAIERIKEASQRMWKEDSLNAVQNFVRAIVQLVPLLGNAALYAFDYVRTNFYFHHKVKQALANQQQPVMGIAFDGKIVASFSEEEFSRALKNPDNNMAVFNYLWLALLTDAHKKDPMPSRLQLAEKLQANIRANTTLA